ncbi:EAL domain-containing protein [Filomicrobium sp.]|uniref:EAL domain-containing protein n=1 Tax=Filomicrobium sp. TaxID=2024831 RepID=UPI00258914E5|nr:EAL domain-containing protein [Filomicrobium sp.]MCV0369146.1 EAL domain-containing protein [Filomicrobium sp.]
MRHQQPDRAGWPGAVLAGVRCSTARLLSLAVAVLVVCCANLIATSPASALKAITVGSDQDRIEITTDGEFYDNRGDSLQVETAPGLDGVVGRMSVKAATPGVNPSWIVFALTNPTNTDMERWLTADRYTVVGSGTVWPDLDARRIEAVTPSIGFVPERVNSDRADVFRITLEPGQTITFVAELSSERFSRIFLWKPLAYELEVRERQLFNGALLGLTGLLAIFLTAIFAANHKAIFPSAALVAWCVLVYLCVDFGFFHKLFNLRPEDNAVYRAAGEASIAASLVIFLHTFLRLGLSHGLVRMLFGVWMLAQLALVAVAVVDPRLASTFARLSFCVIGGVGAAIILFLAFRGQDRALSIIPTWIIFLVWVFGTAVTLTGRMSGDVIEAGLAAGLVLIVLMIGFTVTQFAFRSLEPVYGASPSQQQRQALAVEGAGAATWEWNARRDEVKVSPIIEAALGLNGGELTCKVEDFIPHLHTADREKFRLMLWSVQERAGGKIRIDFRLRHSDNSYRWYELDAASIETSDRRDVRCVGLMRDITESKRAQERLLHNAVHCGLTNLPNRELFLDRLGTACMRAASEAAVRPTVICIDLDKFKSVNASLGLVVGDSLLLTVARRLSRHLGPQDTLARLGGDQFAILILNEQSARDLAGLAERIRRSLRSPIKIAGKEIVLTGSLGVSVYDGEERGPDELLKEAQIAMYRAKRSGADRIEIFRPEMRSSRDDRAAMEAELRKAVEKDQLKVFFQPIVYLPTEDLAGFEAIVRWEHPREGLLSPATFVPLAENSDLIIKLSTHVLTKAAHTAANWQKILPRHESPLFVSVNVSCRQLFKQDFIQELRHIIGQGIVPVNCLRLEVSEPLVMESPEQATEMLDVLRGTGVEIALDEFGTGYSSFAYLQRFPVDTIKIDGGLVQNGGGSEGTGSAIVRSIVALSHELGKKVVAEGIEEPDDVVFLRSIGCEYGQGFYYGDPMPADDVIALLRIIAKSERKIEARNLFKPKSKSKKDRKKASVHVEAAPKAPKPSSPKKTAVVAANGQAPSRGDPGSIPLREVPPPAEVTGPPPIAARGNGRERPLLRGGMLPTGSVGDNRQISSATHPALAPPVAPSQPTLAQSLAQAAHGGQAAPQSAPRASSSPPPLTPPPPVSSSASGAGSNGGYPSNLSQPTSTGRNGNAGIAPSSPPLPPSAPPFSHGRGGAQNGAGVSQPPPIQSAPPGGSAGSRAVGHRPPPPPSPSAAANGRPRMNNGPAVQSPRPPVSTGQTQPLNVAMAGAEVPVTAPPVTPAGNGVPNGAERPLQPVAAPPDYSSLPPGIAESLARLAGTPRPRSDSAARGPSQKAATPNGKLGDK